MTFGPCGQKRGCQDEDGIAAVVGGRPCDTPAYGFLVVQDETGDYSRSMSDKLAALLDRLKAHQRDLILAMAEHDGMPAGSALRQVAELENVIAAVEAVMDEQARR